MPYLMLTKIKIIKKLIKIKSYCSRNENPKLKENKKKIVAQVKNIRKQEKVCLLLHHGGDIIIEKNW